MLVFQKIIVESICIRVISHFFMLILTVAKVCIEIYSANSMILRIDLNTSKIVPYHLVSFGIMQMGCLFWKGMNAKN